MEIGGVAILLGIILFSGLGLGLGLDTFFKLVKTSLKNTRPDIGTTIKFTAGTSTPDSEVTGQCDKRVVNWLFAKPGETFEKGNVGSPGSGVEDNSTIRTG